MNKIKNVLAAGLCLLLFSCVTNYTESYTQVAPVNYPPTTDVTLFEYENRDLMEIYNLLYSDYLIIGRSDFTGGYESPQGSLDYAESIGADLLITTSRFVDTRTDIISSTTPTTTVTVVKGYENGKKVENVVTTYGTTTTQVPVQTDRYDQAGLYLKNVNQIVPLWKRTSRQYVKTGEGPLGGAWKNQECQIEIYQSGKQYVGVVERLFDDNDLWEKNQLKMIFDADTGAGTYLMGNKTPEPSKIALNKFGNLEVSKTDGTGPVASFAKVIP